MNTIDRLEKLAKRAKRPQFMVDEGWDFSSRWSPEKMAAHHEWESACIEFAAIVTDHEVIDDLLKLARAAKAANEAAYNDFPEEWRRLNYEMKLALSPLFSEDPS